jgi:hypothetical protein
MPRKKKRKGHTKRRKTHKGKRKSRKKKGRRKTKKWSAHQRATYARKKRALIHEVSRM